MCNRLKLHPYKCTHVQNIYKILLPCLLCKLRMSTCLDLYMHKITDYRCSFLQVYFSLHSCVHGPTEPNTLVIRCLRMLYHLFYTVICMSPKAVTPKVVQLAFDFLATFEI